MDLSLLEHRLFGSRGSANLFLKGQLVNILGFRGRVALLQLLDSARSGESSHPQYINEQAWLCSSQMSFSEQAAGWGLLAVV